MLEMHYYEDADDYSEEHPESVVYSTRAELEPIVAAGLAQAQNRPLFMGEFSAHTRPAEEEYA